MRKLAIAGMVILTAILVATFASADSVGIGIKKTAPISGTGSSGSPLKIDVCLSGSGYVSNGTSWACETAGSVTGTGTANTVTKWTGAAALGNSLWTDNGTTTTYNTNKFVITASTGTATTAGKLGVGIATPAVGYGYAADVLAHVHSPTAHSFLLVDAVGASQDAGIILASLTAPADVAMFIDESDSQKLRFAMGDLSNDATRLAATKMTLLQNGRFGLGTSAPDDPMHVKFSGPGLNTFRAENTSTTGYSSFIMVDSSAVFRGGMYYENSGTGGPMASKLFLYSAGDDWHLANSSGPAHTFGMTSGSLFYQMLNGSSAAVSAASTGRLRYDSATQTFQASQNGTAYATIPTGTGTANTMTKWTSTSAIGNSSVTDTGALVTVTNPLTVTGAATLSSTLAVAGSATVAGDVTLGDANADTSNIWGRVHNYGTAPTLSGCAICTIHADSTDAAGRITCTDGPNACTVTYSQAYVGTISVCTFGTTSTGVVRQTSAATNTAFTVTSPAGAHSIDYHCSGPK